MIGDLFDSPWKIAIIAILIIVLFGARKLPVAARELGKSMRILKKEVSSLHDDDDDLTRRAAPGAPVQAPGAAPGPGRARRSGRAGADRRAEQAARRPAAVGQTPGQRAGQVGRPPPDRTPDPSGNTRPWPTSPPPSRAPASWASATCAPSGRRTRRGGCPCSTTCASCATGWSRSPWRSSWARPCAGRSTTGSGPSCSGPTARPSGTARKTSWGTRSYYNGVMDGFYLHMKVAIIGGVIVTSPIWLYQLWAFVAPGLYAKEKRWTYVFLGTAVPLFGLGVLLRLPGDEPRAQLLPLDVERADRPVHRRHLPRRTGSR